MTTTRLGKHFLSILVVLLLVSLSACGKAPTKDDAIKEQIISQNHLQQEHTVSFSVTNRETNKKEKYDKVWCTLNTKDDALSYERDYFVYYTLSKEGWSVRDISLLNERILPLYGVNDQLVVTSLDGCSFDVENETWIVTNEATYNIQNQNTDLVALKDSLTIELTIDEGSSQEAHGIVCLDYTWNGSSWNLDATRIVSPFVAAFKQGCEPSFSEGDITSALVSKNIVWDNGNKEQDISVAYEEIENFVLDNGTISNKGNTFVQEATFILNKGLVTFWTSAAIEYEFSHGSWTIADIREELSVKDVNMVGTWTGEYSSSSSASGPNMNATFTVSSQAGDGTLTAIMEFAPKATNLDSEPGSFKMRGGIDLKTLQYQFEPTEWIEKPSSMTDFSFSGQLYVEDFSLRGRFRGMWSSTNAILMR